MKSVLRRLNKNETMRKLLDQKRDSNISLGEEKSLFELFAVSVPFSLYDGCQDKSLRNVCDWISDAGHSMHMQMFGKNLMIWIVNVYSSGKKILKFVIRMVSWFMICRFCAIYMRTRFTRFLLTIIISNHLVMWMHSNRNYVKCFEFKMDFEPFVAMQNGHNNATSQRIHPLRANIIKENHIEYMRKRFFCVCVCLQMHKRKWILMAMHEHTNVIRNGPALPLDRFDMFDAWDWNRAWSQIRNKTGFCIGSKRKKSIMYSMAFRVALLAFANRLRCYFCA